jgi:fucose permease
VLGNRFDHLRLAVVAAIVSAVALTGAVVAPNLAVSIALLAVVGFAFGPIYPMVMAVAGERFRGRTAAVSGLLAGSAVVGGTLYPPVMGLLSVTVGLAWGMVGAGVLGVACAVALLTVRPPVPARSVVPSEL